MTFISGASAVPTKWMTTAAAAILGLAHQVVATLGQVALVQAAQVARAEAALAARVAEILIAAARVRTQEAETQEAVNLTVARGLSQANPHQAAHVTMTTTGLENSWIQLWKRSHTAA